MKLSIVLASRNELEMLMVTVLSAVEQLRTLAVEGEVFIVDNSDPEYWAAVQNLLSGQGKDGIVRVVHEPDPSIAVALDRAHREARGEYLFYTDAHTLIGNGTLEALLRFYEEHPGEPIGFVHAPIQWAHSSSQGRRAYFGLNNTWMGDWGDSVQLHTARKVTWKGMPYMIRRDVWEAIGGLGCCAKHRIGWGVMRYIGIKTWIMGYENWAIPEGVTYHFGEWPKPVRSLTRYRTYKGSGDHRIGIANAIAPYVFGGEELLRAEFDRINLAPCFRGGVEQALAEVRPLAEEERIWIKQHRKWSLQELVQAAPWGDITKPAVTITPEYTKLNADLHKDPEVLYGYKGADQAPEIMKQVKAYRCRSLLDYGAGKRTLSQALQSERNLRVQDYDPAIPEISHEPAPADMVVCTDVMEHVEPELVQNVISHLHALTNRVLFLRVCIVPCTSKSLPDGSDPHRSVHSFDWWTEAFREKFSVQSVLEKDDRYFTLLLRPLR